MATPVNSTGSSFPGSDYSVIELSEHDRITTENTTCFVQAAKGMNDSVFFEKFTNEDGATMRMDIHNADTATRFKEVIVEKMTIKRENTPDTDPLSKSSSQDSLENVDDVAQVALANKGPCTIS